MKKLLTKITLMFLCASGYSCGKEVKIRVVEKGDKPIQDAEIVVWFTDRNGAKDERVEGKTDTQGYVAIQGGGENVVQLAMDVEKKGYYKNSYRHKNGTGIPVIKDQALSVKSVLKKILKPVALYVRSSNIAVPIVGVKVGFDFEVGDFVVPHGKGKMADVYFEKVYAKRGIRDYTYKLNISFPHEKDGIQSFLVKKEDFVSELKSPHSAPIANYAESFSRYRIRRGMGSKIETNKVPNRNHWMRVRTKTGLSVRCA